MNSLKIKILSLTTAILVIAVGLTAWHNLRTQKAMLTQIAIQNSRILGETIRNSIITSMANGENDQVTNILESIKKEPTIAAVRVFDKSGRILISADPEETGDLVSASDLLAYRAGKMSYANSEGDQNYHNSILPIHNAPVCYACHDQTRDVLGILNVHLSLSTLSTLQSEGRKTTFASSLVMLALLIFAISTFILRYVDRPIQTLVAAMDLVERGDFDLAPTRISSSKEMTLLSNRFNTMVDRLKGLIEATISHERELAISQEKLTHHDEISNMNVTLAERLKEIEYLNISLEERIEEIEEANYKIADLAGDLENKNTHLEQAVTRLSAINKIGLAINGTMDLNKLFKLLIHQTAATLKARVGFILLLEEDSSIMSVGAATGVSDRIDMGDRIPLKPGGVSFWVMENRQPLLVGNIKDSKEFSRVSRLGFTRESVICAPLIIKDEPIGTITIANKQDESSFCPEDLELLITISAQASVAIKNARLYEEQQATYLCTVQALVSAIEASDAYTRGHSERVTRYSISLAKRLNLPPAAQKRLEQAAILHDIGKIGIDLTLLHKKGPLSQEDIAALQQHPKIGARILEPIRMFDEVRQIVLHHHERFDGKGYPSQVNGPDIPIEARILAVADTFDAMTSDRPYRRALSHDTAIREIELYSGSQFDPAIAQAFIAHHQQIVGSSYDPA